MNVGRLAWRTPTGAMLWEIWSRNKTGYRWHGAALGAGLCFVLWKRQGISEIPAALLALASLAGFIGGYLQLLSGFAHVEVDPAKVNAGYPGRLLLKPLRTLHLVLVPMLAGGLVTTMVLDVWVACVLKPMGFFAVYSLPWISGVALSLFWWMQVIAWSLPWLRLRTFVLLAVALAHLALGVLPQLTFLFKISAGWQWGIVAASLLSAVPAAWVGLRLMRQGQWDGPSWIAILWGRWLRIIMPGRRTRFRSAFAAQFWLEWQRQGWLLPGLSGALSLVVLPATIFVGRKWTGAGAPPPEAILALMLVGPLLASGVMGTLMAKFDLAGSTCELPGYISVRPMTNGGFIQAKLAMALASSALTILLNVAGAWVCMAIAGQGNPFSKAGLGTPFGPVSYLTGCLPGLLLVVIWTWRNLLAGMGPGLTGRPWIANLGIAWRGASGAGLIALVMAAKLYPDFGEGLLHWLTVILSLWLAAKIVLALAAFHRGWQRNAITARAIGWMAGGWLVSGGFVAGYADHVCRAIHQPGVWLWVALGGFLMLPLADLAIAPLALAWNRHR